MMTPPRTLGYYAASNWLHGSVFLLFCLLLGYWLLGVLNEAQERGEKQAVELAVRNMRTGMQLAMGEALMNQREGEIAGWVGSDPTRWLGRQPDGHRGECSAAQADNLPAGAWCFDRERRELAYGPRNAAHLRIQPTADGRQSEQLRWRVARAPESAAAGGFVGLRVEIVTRYKWLLD